ncbi:HEPN-associated N-terminal domain-containing protein [Sphingomonas sp. G-3-2-10]|uniref:HEPN-associated N-terminal domain-containing protein n=1 Tax=Sphingomonas sp. G-3-2-10 TaxID=2728838 RepID=UPI00146F1A7C|nr:HEPN-associated N-terminal domain-containing protein [Sphingomonas sp. G-3-2-10]NML05961.1 RES family NAD+ phosphorylase [Sphingomonas sp. G-3-2-10]
MGIVKAYMMELEERGYGESDDHVCAACVTDPYLAEWIAGHAESKACSFCDAGSDQPIAAPFEAFTEIVLGGLGFDWNEPTNEGIMYISREGGWQAPLSTTADVLYDASFSENDDLIAALDEMIECDAWVEREFYRGTDSQRLTWGWDSFKAYTKNHTRYFFLQAEDEGYDELTPGQVLATVSDMIGTKLNGEGLIKPIGTGTDLIRIRVDDQPQTTATEIGTPKPEHARQSNRMSPAGIPMFYGAFDTATAHAETFDPAAHAGKILSIGTFRALRDLTVLDLAELPPVPSVFDVERQGLIHTLRFLHAFAEDISQPVDRDGREHIGYVPTQIVTEYFRRMFRLAGGQRLDGIIYRSAKHVGEKAFVLFCENEQCIDTADEPGAETLLRLVAVAHQ